MRKIVCFLVAICLFCSLFGCSLAVENKEGLQIVCSVFPQYDFLRALTKGANVSLSLLLRPGQESHDFDPSSQDIASIHTCDLFVYVGGESDSWIDKALTSVDVRDKTVLKLMDMVQPLSEEHGHDHGHGEHHAHEEAYDEHVWTSPQKAAHIADKLTSALCTQDPANAPLYRQNAKAYTAQLYALDTAFEQVVNHARRNVMVVADRFPLLYFTERYGLSHHAAFAGCASSVEPASADVFALINTVKAENIPVIFQMELSAGTVAGAVKENTGCAVRTFYACHNISKTDFENGETYLSLMQKNLSALKEALN